MENVLQHCFDGNRSDEAERQRRPPPDPGPPERRAQHDAVQSAHLGRQEEGRSNGHPIEKRPVEGLEGDRRAEIDVREQSGVHREGERGEEDQAGDAPENDLPTHLGKANPVIRGDDPVRGSRIQVQMTSLVSAIFRSRHYLRSRHPEQTRQYRRLFVVDRICGGPKDHATLSPGFSGKIRQKFPLLLQ